MFKTSWLLPACGCSERSPLGLCCLRGNNARTGGADFDVDADALLHARRRPEAPPGGGTVGSRASPNPKTSAPFPSSSPPIQFGFSFFFFFLFSFALVRWIGAWLELATPAATSRGYCNLCFNTLWMRCDGVSSCFSFKPAGVVVCGI